MKILIMLGGFFPAKNYGGPPVSINNLCTLLNKDNEFYIVTKNREFKTNEKLTGIEEGWNSKYNAKILYLEPNEFKIKNFEKIVNEIKPDVIYVNSLFLHTTFIPSCMLSSKYKIPLLIAPRGELCKNAFKKKYKKIPYILFVKRMLNADLTYFHSTSLEETNAIMKYLKIKKERIFQVENVPTMSSISNEKKTKNKGKMKSVFISRIHPKKNLLFLIECLSKIKGDLLFDIYGPIEDKEYWNKVQEAINLLPSNVHVNYLGNLNHDLVIETFRKYDTFLFYTLSENYGHVIAEAINASCVPIISDQTPWCDLKEHNAGAVSSLDNIEECIENIQNFVDYDNDEFEKILNNLNEYKKYKINIEDIREKYLLMFNKVVQNID